MKRIVEKIKADGWKSFLPAVTYRVNKLAGDVYSKIVLRNPFFTHLLPFATPPILLLSFPRSGSSWVGEVLAQSENLAYLFEPVTRPYQKYQSSYAMADLRNPRIYQKYLEYSTQAFQGMPLREWDSSENSKDFSLLGRKHRRLLIKEVNPRATELYCQHFHPVVLFLIRHPAAVALSFWNQGWLTSPDVQMDTTHLDGDEWFRFGYAYGSAMEQALETLQRLKVGYNILHYEDLAEDPFTQFKTIYEYLAVDPPHNYSEVINEYCFSDPTFQGYETRRISKMMIAKWKKQLTPAMITNIRNGYFRSGFDFYQAEIDWTFAAFDEF